MAFGSPALIPLLLLASLLVDPEVLCYSDYNQMREFDDYYSNVPEGGGGAPWTPDHTPRWQGEGHTVPNLASPSPPSSSSLSPPPPPPRELSPPPKQNATRNEWYASPSEAEKHNKSYVAKLGWAFLGAGLALQLVLGAYLAYQRREMQRFGMWLEKIPSISPPPSPAGFAPYTAAR